MTRWFTNLKVPAGCVDPVLLPANGLDAEDPAVLVDVAIADAAFIQVVLAGSGTAPMDATETIDLGGAITFPGFLDAHVHLDKTHTWGRSPNRSRTFPDAIETLFKDEAHWTEEDILRRADFALQCAYAHGTTAIRSHFNCPAGPLRHHHHILRELAERWADRLTLQYLPLCADGGYSTPTDEAYFDRAVASGCCAIGGMPLMNPDLRAQLDRMFALAAERAMPLDLHIDENPDPASETLREVALGVLRNAFPHPVTCGHCCSLSRQSSERQADTLRFVAEAGLHIIPLPMCNSFLMDRGVGEDGPLTPQWRGVTLIHEMLSAGINVAVASDNVRDAFYAWGDYDVAEVFQQSTRIAQLDSRLAEAAAMVTANPARLMQLLDRGKIAPGQRADFVTFAARSLNELLARPNTPRTVYRKGERSAAAAPDYSLV